MDFLQTSEGGLMTQQFKTTEDNLFYSGVLDLEPNEVFQNQKQISIIDVRQTDEFNGDLGHIKDSILIPLETLEEEISKFSNNSCLVFVCRSGTRSARAASQAIELGYKNSFNMKGGMILWNEQSLPAEIVN